jgi:hypothetical protein
MVFRHGRRKWHKVSAIMPFAAKPMQLFELVQSHRITAVIYSAAKLGLAEALRDGAKNIYSDLERRRRAASHSHSATPDLQ